MIFHSYVKLPEGICCNRWKKRLCTEASATLGSPKSKTASTANLGTTLGTPAVHDLRSKKYQKIWANCIKMHKKKLPFRSWYHPWLTRRGQGMASGQVRRAHRSAVPPFGPELLTFQARRQCPWSTMEPWWNRWNWWNRWIKPPSLQFISYSSSKLISYSYHTHLPIWVCLKAFWVHHCNWRQKLSDTTSL